MTARVAIVGRPGLDAATRALSAAGYEVAPLTIDESGHWHGAGDRGLGLSGAVAVLRSCMAVVPMLPGPDGEDGTVAMLCDLVGVPFVGSPPKARALAMDPWATGVLAKAVGLRGPAEEGGAGSAVSVAVLAQPGGARMVAPDPDAKELEEAAVAVFDAFGCAGVARIAFARTDDGVVLTEVDAVPALADDAPVVRLFGAAGVAYPQLLDLLVTGAVGRTR